MKYLLAFPLCELQSLSNNFSRELLAFSQNLFEIRKSVLTFQKNTNLVIPQNEEERIN